MFVTRLISGIVLIILAVVTLWFGGVVTGIVTMLLSLVGVFELMRVYKVEKKLPGIVAYVWTVGYYIILMLDKKEFVMPLLVTYMIVLLGIYVFTFPRYHDKETMAAFFSFFYVGVMLSYLYQVRILPDGGYFVVLIFLSSWGNDTLAYCTGMLFGKHKMSPKLSPKKSVEGLIGGIIGAGLLGAIYGFGFNMFVRPIDNLPLLLFVICAVGAIPAVIGDLAASAIKRNNEVKDYGKLIPGHGGVMDRFDSMIFTAPIVFYLMKTLLQAMIYVD